MNQASRCAFGPPYRRNRAAAVCRGRRGEALGGGWGCPSGPAGRVQQARERGSERAPAVAKAVLTSHRRGVVGRGGRDVKARRQSGLERREGGAWAGGGDPWTRRRRRVGGRRGCGCGCCDGPAHPASLGGLLGPPRPDGAGKAAQVMEPREPPQVRPTGRGAGGRQGVKQQPK